MAGMESDLRRASLDDVPPARARSDSISRQREQPQVVTNERLDRENRVVVEILTDEEASALEKWWPRCHGGTYALRFAVVDGGVGGTDILWSTSPCRECDPSSRSTADIVVRNRLHQKRGYR